MTEARVRVLVVDDSAFARKVIRESLSASPAIEVVGVARDGLDALEKISLLSPDVVTLDLVMPNLDGLGFMGALPPNPPRIVVVSSAADESELVIGALQMGAIAFVQKPTAQATDRMYEIGTPLVDEVLRAMRTRPRASQTSTPIVVSAARYARSKVLVVGASTGGPQALTQLFSALPASFRVPAAIVLHIPVGYTEGFAKRLDESSPLSVTEAHEGLVLRPGAAAVARAGLHLVLVRGHDDAPTAHLEIVPLDTAHRPSVDVMFKSAAAAYGADVLGVVLTGMGDDGLLGARAIREAGGMILTQSEDTCVVYGMPRVVVEAGLSTRAVAIEEMAAAIVELA